MSKYNIYIQAEGKKTDVCNCNEVSQVQYLADKLCSFDSEFFDKGYVYRVKEEGVSHDRLLSNWIQSHLPEGKKYIPLIDKSNW